MISDTMSLIERSQLRAARAAVGWTQAELAAQSGVSLPTVKRLETCSGPLSTRVETQLKLQRALEAAGVEFTNGDAPGVRMRRGG